MTVTNCFIVKAKFSPYFQSVGGSLFGYRLFILTAVLCRKGKTMNNTEKLNLACKNYKLASQKPTEEIQKKWHEFALRGSVQTQKLKRSFTGAYHA